MVRVLCIPSALPSWQPPPLPRCCPDCPQCPLVGTSGRPDSPPATPVKPQRAEKSANITMTENLMKSQLTKVFARILIGGVYNWQLWNFGCNFFLRKDKIDIIQITITTISVSECVFKDLDIKLLSRHPAGYHFCTNTYHYHIICIHIHLSILIYMNKH